VAAAQERKLPVEGAEQPAHPKPEPSPGDDKIFEEMKKAMRKCTTAAKSKDS